MTSNNSSSSQKKIPWGTVGRLIPPILLLILCFGILVYYILGPAEGYFHSDCTDTLWWAQASYDAKALISDNFHYAALLPFGGSLLMLPFIPLFGVSMMTHNIGMILFAALFIASLAFLGRSLGYNLYATSALTFVVIFLLSSSDKLREIMWGHVIYYSLGILFFCVGMGLIARLLRAADNGLAFSKKHVVGLALLLLFTMATATNGIQSLITYILPLIGALILERIFAEEEWELLKKRSLHNGLLLGLLLGATLFGLLLLKLLSGGVTAGYASAYSTYSPMDEWVVNAHLFFDHWFSLLGVSVEARDPIVSVKSVINIIRIFTGFFVLFFPVISLFFYRKVTSRWAHTLLISHFILSALILYAYIFGLLASANWRLVPMLGSAAITSVVWAIELIRPKGFEISKRIGVLSLCFLLIAPGLSLFQIAKMPAEYGRNNHLHQLTEALKEHDLEYGYADFWLSQSITLLSDSEVKVRNVTIDDDGVTKYEYQSQYTWFEDQPGVEEYFLLLSNYHERLLDMWLFDQENITKVIELDGYTIYVFSDNLF